MRAIATECRRERSLVEINEIPYLRSVQHVTCGQRPVFRHELHFLTLRRLSCVGCLARFSSMRKILIIFACKTVFSFYFTHLYPYTLPCARRGFSRFLHDPPRFCCGRPHLPFLWQSGLPSAPNDSWCCPPRVSSTGVASSGY